MAELPYAKKPEDYAEYKDIKGISVDEALVEGLGSVDHSEDDDMIESVAREKLGLVKPGEKIFYDTSD